MSGAVESLGSATVGWPTVIVGFVAMAVLFAIPIWALRKHARMFPKGWDRTGWSPEPGKARRFETMWAWLSGGRGS